MTAQTQASLRNLGARLRVYRKNNDLTLVTVSERTGISVSFLSEIERGKSLPSLETLLILAHFYGAPVSYLLA